MENKNQVNLYKERLIIKRLFQQSEITTDQYSFIYKFLNRNKKIVKQVLVLTGIQICIEVIFFVLTHNLLNTFYKPLYQKFNIYFILFTLFIIFTYILVVFISVKKERKFVLGFVNHVRKSMFDSLLSKSIQEIPITKRLGFVSRLSYHISLFSLGLDNTVMSLIRWIFYFAIFIVYIVVFNPIYFWYIPVLFVFSGLLFITSYKISNVFISKEAASYSKINDYVVKSVYNLPLIKRQLRERDFAKNLDKIVTVDTYFRLRRDIWIRYSNGIIFIALSIFAVIYSILYQHSPGSVDIASIFFKGIVSMYVVRLFYLSIRAGLYAVPLRIGVALSIPEKESPFPFYRKNWDWKSMTFFSNKVKLFPQAEYFKDFSNKFDLGKKYLFFAPHSFSGKTSLAEIFSGDGRYSRHSFMVKVDNERMTYNTWADSFKDKYFFSTNIFGSLTVGEYLFNKDKQLITNTDILNLNTLLEKYQIFNKFSLGDNMIGSPIEQYQSNYVTIFYIHILYVLLNKINFIIIDNFWVDLQYNDINELIQSVESSMPESCIILFSRNKNSLLSYEKVYEISETAIKEIDL